MITSCDEEINFKNLNKTNKANKANKQTKQVSWLQVSTSRASGWPTSSLQERQIRSILMLHKIEPNRQNKTDNKTNKQTNKYGQSWCCLTVRWAKNLWPWARIWKWKSVAFWLCRSSSMCTLSSKAFHGGLSVYLMLSKLTSTAAETSEKMCFCHQIPETRIKCVCW